jgi:hypothetical protein
MGAANAEEEPGFAADGRDSGKPAARDLVGGLAVVDAANGLRDRDVSGVDGACGDEELGGARVGPGIRVETRSAGEETRGGEALGIGRVAVERGDVAGRRDRDEVPGAADECCSKQLVDAGDGIVTERCNRCDGERATRERKAREHRARSLTETSCFDERSAVCARATDATGLGPPRLEGADVLAGKVGLRLFGDGAQPAKLVRGGELGAEVERRHGDAFPRREICSGDEDDDETAPAVRDANELAGNGPIPCALARKGRDDGGVRDGGGLGDRLGEDLRLAGDERRARQSELAGDLTEDGGAGRNGDDARDAVDATVDDGRPAARADAPRGVREERRVHILGRADDDDAGDSCGGASDRAKARAGARDEPLVEVDERPRGLHRLG